MKKKSIVLFALAAIILGSCAPASRITGTWKNPNARRNYDDIMVAALSGSVDAKSTVEKELTTALAAKGLNVSASLELFPPKFGKDVSKEALMKKVRKRGTDAILTVTMLDEKTETRHVPGTYGYRPIPMYDRFWGYYNYWQPVVVSPGYYTEDKVYYMEMNLYDTKTEQLIWSAQTETYYPENIGRFSQQLATIIANKLDQDGLIEPAIQKQKDPVIGMVGKQ